MNNPIFEPNAIINNKNVNNTNINVKYYVNYININSINRNKYSSLTYFNQYELENNPLSIVDNILWINMPEHNLNVGDLITLSDLSFKSKDLKTVTTISNNLVYSIIFTEDSDYVKIKTSPNISITLLSSNALTYDTSLMFVELSGFAGFPTSTHLGNIAINELNNVHQIYLSIPNSVETDEQPSNNYFFIKLSKKFTGSISTTSYNITVILRHYGGVPTNEINADLPINNYHIYSNHSIFKSQTDKIAIKLNRIGYISENFGGNNIIISHINEIKNGYINSNSYKINLYKTLTNIVQIKMISSIFPNTDKMIKTNNKLYFQNIENGDIIYNIDIPAGNYTTTILKNTIENKIYDTENYILIDIDTQFNKTTFTGYKETILNKPIINIIRNNTQYVSYTVVIYHENHNILDLIDITILNCLAHNGIPANILNGVHTITNIIDNNTYEFIINYFNLDNSMTSTNGGDAVYILTPNKYRLRFDYEDSKDIATQLGFRNAGQHTSITQYNSIITNLDLYLDEYNYIYETQKKILRNNSYINITCDEITTINNSSKNKNIFAKINMTEAPYNNVIDGHVKTPIFLYEPIEKISELTLNFYNEDDKLINFDGLEHSFVLEITTLDNQPEKTNLICNSSNIR